MTRSPWAIVLTSMWLPVLGMMPVEPSAVRAARAGNFFAIAANPAASSFEAGTVGKLPRVRVVVQNSSEDSRAMHDIFKRRHCVRSFQPREVSRGDLQTIVAAADSAPSAGGLKSREILVVTDSERKKLLVRAALEQEFVGQAPVVLVFWAVPSRSASKYGERGRNLFALQDATIAASFAWLQAVASGLSGCWVGAFDDDAVKSIFRRDVERDWRPIALLPIGYAAE